ncbi:hypothetical protein CHLRE_01g006733v5 [Chlamydomonas reinhardtii]|uniref:Uncharacterized protein n=1 Tax=Chlamydomonas reinhardtii TaxID=3055 RepID=A0A2K3DM64_CHLRE|nr:uncharacterized protein CHLRE_12g539205v5 [Chlamydomonas reinhardtii]XP_042920272.1 uncharacterized protein CHLRE_10g445395v5 [Chlamydomonas reinhardtii]XP_042923360.1 uncharacterized protein CHLRE_06g253758v5 [Chlamydomonas reinhardtii]XP_042928128.1 uncharacterized protein CHLRE_01g006733v5 [Chlamydomonas reinhardtii]PNW75751.1 hypothetical protein CHLRE_12g539205v5 [Chlamydomonas reinhardtii]PNW77646.1 hypothetical protein CHLRE_10g445395v5 [Chlamydomonas reinhardtii]PNW81625.1 hypothet
MSESYYYAGRDSFHTSGGGSIEFADSKGNVVNMNDHSHLSGRHMHLIRLSPAQFDANPQSLTPAGKPFVRLLKAMTKLPTVTLVAPPEPGAWVNKLGGQDTG